MVEKACTNIYSISADIYPIQGSPILVLEGQRPAEFSSSLFQHTFLESSSNPENLDYFSSGVINWGWS